MTVVQKKKVEHDIERDTLLYFFRWSAITFCSFVRDSDHITN